MSHRCDYYGRVELKYGKIYRVLKAVYGNYSLDIFKECLETGKCQARNIHYTGLGGWLVDFPKERINRYVGCGYREDYIMPLEKWWETSNYTGFGYSQNEIKLEEAKKIILKAHPELKYLMAKLNPKDEIQYSQLFQMIRAYWKHPESETLFQLGYYQLAMNENLYRLTKPKLKEVLNVLNTALKEKYFCDIQLKDIQTYIKANKKQKMSFVEWLKWYEWNGRSAKYTIKNTVEEWHYCLKQNITKYEYHDYLEMAKKVGHDINEDYWHYPKDFRKFHDKVMEQQKSLEIAKYGVQQEFLKEILKPMLKYNTNIDGYDIFLSTKAEEWQLTCDTLYQCLLRNGYMKRVIMQEELIVFIWKNGVPLATAEVFYDKKLGQFYGDERNHSLGGSCLPSEEVQQVFNKWLDSFKPMKVNFNLGLKNDTRYYKGFTDIVKGGFHTHVGSMDGVGKGSTFLIGQTYETNFDDETIICENSKCVSTNKVFHFCNSITEISKHYSPKYYAEIKPLGPVVENNGALLSNKIKIMRIIPEEELKMIKIQEMSCNL